MEFDTPSPQKRNGHDFSANPLNDAVQINYKTGKLEEVSVKMFFDNRLTPDDLTQHFEYYDSDLKEKIPVHGFTAYVVGVYFGSFSNGSQKGDLRYISNLVQDTRTDIIQSSYFINSKRETFAIGNYKTDIAPAFERLVPKRTSTYTKVLVAYVAELKRVCCFHLNATAEAGLVKAIAKARNIEEYKASIFGLSDLETEVWVFKFSGQFEPVVFSPKDAKKVAATVPADAKAKIMYFQPVFEAGVFRSDNPKHEKEIKFMQSEWEQLTEYIASEQAFFKAQMGIKDAPSTDDEPEEFEDRVARNVPENYNSDPFPNNSGFGGYNAGAFPPIVDVPFPNEEPPATEGDDLPF